MQTRQITIEEYPYLLKQIKPPPPFLHLAGRLPPESHRFLCVIGARDHSDYGRDVCARLISELRDYPISIVSGLAMGIDSLAHEAALKEGLHTISFPGSGLADHVLYPSCHKNLSQRILDAGGALLSPFDMGQEGAFWTFPFRNRLMAGISQATLIIEARKGSGTLLTAEYALGFNREVLVVPGSIFSDLSYGPHMLLDSGATPVRSAKDILRVLDFPVIEDSGQFNLFDADRLSSLSPDETTVFEYMRYGAYSSSDLIERTAFPTPKLNIILSHLEMEGLIVESGGKYRLNMERK